MPRARKTLEFDVCFLCNRCVDKYDNLCDACTWNEYREPFCLLFQDVIRSSDFADRSTYERVTDCMEKYGDGDSPQYVQHLSGNRVMTEPEDLD